VVACERLDHPLLHSFPTRRSSDLCGTTVLVPRKRSMRPSMPYASTPQPDCTAMYCTPSTSNDVGTPVMPELVRNCHSNRPVRARSEEHTSELQSRENLVCRLLLEK